MLPQVRQAASPPFSTPCPLIKPESTGDPRPEAFGGLPSIHPPTDPSDTRGYNKAQLFDLAPSGSTALPMSAGFKSAAQHSFEQHSKADGVRQSTGLLVHSLTGGLPFPVPQLIQGPFVGTVFEPASRLNKDPATAIANSSIAVAEHPRPGSPAAEPVIDNAKPTAASSDNLATPEDGEVGNSLAAVHQAAALAAAQDVQAAEQFAAEALQLPKAELCEAASRPVSTLHSLIASQPSCHGR